MFLSALATINFSLAFLVGLICSPLTFAQYYSGRPTVGLILGIFLIFCSPPAVLVGSSLYLGISLESILLEAAFGWDVWGMWTQVVVWCVWWPAWMTGAILVASSITISAEAPSAETISSGTKFKSTNEDGSNTLLTKA